MLNLNGPGAPKQLGFKLMHSHSDVEFECNSINFTHYHKFDPAQRTHA